MFKGFVDFGHKASSIIAALALVAATTPSLQPYQPLLTAIAGLLGGSAVVGNVVTPSK